jgi:hypothetical protein
VGEVTIPFGGHADRSSPEKEPFLDVNLVTFSGVAENLFTRALLPEKLRTIRMARASDGEAFAMLVANPQVDSPVKLDLRLIEADQVGLAGQMAAFVFGGISVAKSNSPSTTTRLKFSPRS